MVSQGRFLVQYYIIWPRIKEFIPGTVHCDSVVDIVIHSPYYMETFSYFVYQQQSCLEYSCSSTWKHEGLSLCQEIMFCGVARVQTMYMILSRESTLFYHPLCQIMLAVPDCKNFCSFTVSQYLAMCFQSSKQYQMVFH